MGKSKSIAVYCGSRMGADEIYQQQAIKFAEEMVKRNITLVYGGASVGIMGTVANTILSLGGKVIGIIPSLLEKREISHKHLTELHIVETMHQRKNKMIDEDFMQENIVTWQLLKLVPLHYWRVSKTILPHH